MLAVVAVQTSWNGYTQRISPLKQESGDQIEAPALCHYVMYHVRVAWIRNLKDAGDFYQNSPVIFNVLLATGLSSAEWNPDIWPSELTDAIFKTNLEISEPPWESKKNDFKGKESFLAHESSYCLAPGQCQEGWG